MIHIWNRLLNILYNAQTMDMSSSDSEKSDYFDSDGSARSGDEIQIEENRFTTVAI